MDMVSIFKQQLDRNEERIRNIKPDKLDSSTPCTDMNARALLNHMIGGNFMFSEIVQGKTIEMSGEMPDFVGDDPGASFAGSKQSLLSALDDPEAMRRTFRFPFGEMPAEQGLGVMMLETVVHGWDLARATGQDATIDPTLATMMLEGLGAAFEQYRSPDGNPFGPAVEVPEDASPTDKLVAFVGRTP